MSKQTTETLRNAYSGKTAAVRVKVNDRGIRYITARQYNAALAKLGSGPVRCEHGFMVYTDTGREYATVESDPR